MKELIRPYFREESVIIEKNFTNSEEYRKHLAFEYENVLDKDGRINSGFDINGNVVSVTVSPYNKKFYNNIEEGVKELIKSLYEKRYYTYSSCAGHHWSDRRFVGLVFLSIEERENFIKTIQEQLGYYKKYVYMIEKRSVGNMNFEMEKHTEHAYSQKINYQTEEEILEQEKRDVDYFNFIFKQNREKYYYLDMEIFKNFYHKNKIIYQIEKYKRKYLKEKITKKIIDIINSNSFPKMKRY